MRNKTVILDPQSQEKAVRMVRVALILSNPKGADEESLPKSAIGNFTVSCGKAKEGLSDESASPS